MNKEQVVDILNEFQHLEHNDWDSRVFETKELYDASSVIDKRLMKEAYAIALNLDKDHKRDNLIEQYLKNSQEIELSKKKTLRYEILPKKGRRHMFDILTVEVNVTFVDGKKRSSRKTVDRQENVSEQDVWQFIQSQLGMFYHYIQTDNRLVLIEYED